jgi:hypothetical protein
VKDARSAKGRKRDAGNDEGKERKKVYNESRSISPYFLLITPYLPY